MQNARTGRRLATPFVILVLALLVGSCGWGRGRGGQDGGTTVVGWKTVMRKAAPAYLIATDLAQCTVSAKRFSEVKEGDNVFCSWRQAMAGPETPNPGPDVGAPRDPNQPRMPPVSRPPPR